jgi:hypothetical protein
MSIWASRGRIFLLVIFALMAATYLAERLVYHIVVGTSGLLSSLVITAILAGLGWLIYRGHGWLRWLVAAFFVLNGLGTPRGLAELFGPFLAQIIALSFLVAHVGCALALCLMPGIPAFLRYQRTKGAASSPTATKTEA